MRWRGWLSGLWAGMLLAVAFIAAPALFQLLERASAGRVAGRIFMIEAYVSLGFAVVLFVLERSLARADAERGRGSVLSANLLLVLGALMCTVGGYFALQPMMAAARADPGSVPFTFGQLHAMSSALYGLKAVLVLTLAWRTAALPLSPPPAS